MDCLFCKIARKKIPAEIIYEDDAAAAFLDIHPHGPGHTMVIPKRHAENILELPEKDAGRVFVAVRRVTGLLKRRLEPDGFTIGINHGAVSGAVVEHLHIHIIPRFTGDGGKSIHAAVYNPGKETVAEVARKIRGHR